MHELLGTCSLEALRARTSEKWATFPPEVLPAFVAEMDFDVAPTILEAVASVLARSDLGYPHPVTLGAAFAAFAGEEWGWAFDPGRVHAAADVMTGVATMLVALTPPGSGVVVNPPVYPPFLFRTEQAERRAVPVPLVDGRFDLEKLDEALSAPDVAAYLLCSPHNPLGRVWSREELLAIAELCWRHDVILFADEIHAPLVLPGSQFVPVQSLDHPIVERSVAFHSASKAWNIPGLKCGLVVSGSEALAAVAATRWEALFPSQLGVVASEVAFTDPVAREWLRALVAQLEENRRLVGPLLTEALPGARWWEPEASFLVWVDCTALGLGDDPAVAFLERGGVALGRGPDFGTPGIGHARLNIGTSPELLAEIVRRMGRALG